MKIKNGKIEFNRGDDDAILVALKNGDKFEEGDRVFFSVKKNAEDTTDVFQIESTVFVEYKPTPESVPIPNGACLVTIPHAETIELELGDYFYDVLVVWANNTNTTLQKPIAFKLVPGGSHGEPV